MQRGLTLMELIVALVIAGILAAVMIPNFTPWMEKAKAAQAISYLKIIRAAEKMYYQNNNGVYASCPNNAAINTTLGVEITEDYYTFNVTLSSTTFSALAQRKSDASTITLGEDGTFGGSSNYKPS